MKIYFKNEVEIKTFSDTQKKTHCQPTGLQAVLKKVLQVRGKQYQMELRSTASKEIALIIKKIPTKKSLEPDSFACEFYQTFKK